MADFKMPEINYVVLAGNLTRDPVYRQTPNGGALVSFTIALNKRFRDSNNQWKEDVYFVNINARNKLAESCSQKLKRGSAVLLEGELQSRNWRSDEKSALKIVEVKARRIQFLSRPVLPDDENALKEGKERPSDNEQSKPVSFEDDQNTKFISNEESDLLRRGSPDP